MEVSFFQDALPVIQGTPFPALLSPSPSLSPYLLLPLPLPVPSPSPPSPSPSTLTSTQQAASSILSNYYDSSLRKALMALFPEIGHLHQMGKCKSLSFFPVSLLSSLSSSVLSFTHPSPVVLMLMYKSVYRHRHERKAFFENFAREKGFDPLVPDNWYHRQGYIAAEQV